MLFLLFSQRCELCPHKDGALKRTDNGGRTSNFMLTLFYFALAEEKPSPALVLIYMLLAKTDCSCSVAKYRPVA